MNPIPELIAKRLKALSRLIGNTPLLAIEFTYKGEPRVIYSKSEQFNMTGSIKDRMALHILQDAYEKGTIKPGDRIVEATSGNTGISFSAIGRALGHPVVILMPDWMSRERVDIIGALGAKIVPVTREQGGFVGSIEMARDIARNEANIFLPSQFSNQANVTAHATTTGREIWAQFQSNSLLPEAFVAGVGTGGTIMGVGRFLKEKNPAIRIHPLEPSESPTLSTGHKVGHHRIQGISDEFIPEIVDLKKVDTIVGVSDGDAILMAQKLAGELGIAVGISSGANFIGALKIQNTMGGKAVVGTVFSDSNKKYLSTALLSEEPIKPGYLSPDIQLTGLQVFKRVCEVCCEMFDCPQRSSVHNPCSKP